MSISPELRENAVQNLYAQARDVMNQRRSQTSPLIKEVLYEIGFIHKVSPSRRISLYHSRQIPIDYEEESEALIEVLPTSFQFPVICIAPESFRTHVSSPYGDVPSAILTPSGRKFWLSNYYYLNSKGESLKLDFILEATSLEFEDDLFEPVNFEADEDDVRLVEFVPGDFEYLGAELQSLLNGEYEVEVSESSSVSAK